MCIDNGSWQTITAVFYNSFQQQYDVGLSRYGDFARQTVEL